MPSTAKTRKPTSPHPRGAHHSRAFGGSLEQIPLLFRLPDVSPVDLSGDGVATSPEARPDSPNASDQSRTTSVHDHGHQLQPHQYASGVAYSEWGGEQSVSDMTGVSPFQYSAPIPDTEAISQLPSAPDQDTGIEDSLVHGALGSTAAGQQRYEEADALIEESRTSNGSWWDHWSSGVVVILLIITLVTLLILAMNRDPEPKPSLLAEFGINEDSVADIEVPEVEGIVPPSAEQRDPLPNAKDWSRVASHTSTGREGQGAETKSPERGDSQEATSQNSLVVDPSEVTSETQTGLPGMGGLATRVGHQTGPAAHNPGQSTDAAMQESLIPDVGTESVGSNKDASKSEPRRGLAEQMLLEGQEVASGSDGDLSLTTDSSADSSEEPADTHLPSLDLLLGPDPTDDPGKDVMHSSEHAEMSRTTSPGSGGADPSLAPSLSKTVNLTPDAEGNAIGAAGSGRGSLGSSIRNTATPDDDTDALLRVYQEYRREQMKSMSRNRYQQTTPSNN